MKSPGISETKESIPPTSSKFTMMEWYEAYADYQRVMDVAEGLMKHLVTALTGSTKIKVGDHEVDLSKWPRIPMVTLVKKHLEIDYDTVSDSQLKELLKKNNLKIEGVWSKGLAFFTLFDHLISHKLIEQTWVIDYPKEVSPLSKQHRNDDRFVERFEGYIGGKEIFDGWSEINDPLDQRSRFENEQRILRLEMMKPSQRMKIFGSLGIRDATFGRNRNRD